MNHANNIILATDSYKQTHHKMYPPKLEYVESYFESRAGGEYKESVFFGMHYLLKSYFEGVRVTRDNIDEADAFCKAHFGQALFNRDGWEHILYTHGGRLPISIHAVKEGMVVPESNVLFTVTNTDPTVPWLVNHLETLLVQLWYPCTVATISREQKKVLKAALEKSGTLDRLPISLHDFGYRGSTSVESAAIGGAAHLVNFVGTDTIAGIELLRKYYDADMPGISVPAAEHSTITSWGEDDEEEAYRHILQQYPQGFVSVVSDSWDVIAACRDIWGDYLKDEVTGNSKRTLVIRPDSGDPVFMLPQILSVLKEKFGCSTNGKGYMVFPSYLSLIQGDGITRHSLPKILDAIMAHGWSVDNFVFGSGGGLLQDCTRDTLRYALKCCWVQIDGKGRDVSKQPISDMSKASKAGRLKLVRVHEPWAGQVDVWDTYKTVKANEPGDTILEEVFRDGAVLTNPKLDDIRKRAEVGLR